MQKSTSLKYEPSLERRGECAADYLPFSAVHLLFSVYQSFTV